MYLQQSIIKSACVLKCRPACRSPPPERGDVTGVASQTRFVTRGRSQWGWGFRQWDTFIYLPLNMKSSSVDAENAICNMGVCPNQEARRNASGKKLLITIKKGRKERKGKKGANGIKNLAVSIRWLSNYPPIRIIRFDQGRKNINY